MSREVRRVKARKTDEAVKRRNNRAKMQDGEQRYEARVRRRRRVEQRCEAGRLGRRKVKQGCEAKVRMSRVAEERRTSGRREHEAGETEPRTWGGARARKQVGHERN